MNISWVNKGMSVEDFKFIYWMEYAHRLGKSFGLCICCSLHILCCKRLCYPPRQLGLRLFALFALGGGQGLIGWWMVKSGLEEPASEHVQPRVSPYRLATHLTSVFVIYCGILWTALSVVMPDPPAGSMNWVNGAAKIRKMAIPVSAVAGITALFGAFVAGNDAGHAYNSFPKMGDTWIPEDVFSMEPFIRNFLRIHLLCRQLLFFLMNVAEHTGMPSTAVPPPPPTYEVLTSPNLSLESYTSDSAIGVENPDDTLNRIAREMFGGYVNASVSADGNYSSPLDDNLALF